MGGLNPVAKCRLVIPVGSVSRTAIVSLPLLFKLVLYAIVLNLLIAQQHLYPPKRREPDQV